MDNIENPELITLGQTIELSGHEAPSEQVYVVQEGDTVSEIGKKFGVRWLDIASDNQLEDINVIKVGQKLIIPSQGVAR